MSIWLPVSETAFSIVLWIVVWAQDDEDMQALIIAGTLGGPVLMPILSAISWYLYLTT